MSTAVVTTAGVRQFLPRGGAFALMQCRDAEVLFDGPANTGKSFAALWKLHLALLKYPGTKCLLMRKTYVSLKASTLVTYRERVAKVWIDTHEVRFWSSKGDEPPHYAYRNGSKLVVGGMDDPGKIMSSEYDLALWDEATDGTIDDWEALGTRMRYGVMPYRQRIACVNPRQPSHWINERANAGQMTRLLSRHEDNPTVTPEYLATLDGLTGVRRARLYLGVWAGAEGGIYEGNWDRRLNVRPRGEWCGPLSDKGPLYGDCGIPRQWPRVLGIDFGFTNPFVAQWYAVDPDGRLILYRELYRSHRLVEDHAKDILRVCGWELRQGRPFPLGLKSDPLPISVICDHDAEDRHTLARHTGLATLGAFKDVASGLQAVAARMRPAGDGKPRLIVLEDSLVERDPELAERHLPLCFVDEVDGYVWDTRQGRTRGEQPLKENDHAMDTARYVVASRDLRDNDTSVLRSVW